RAPKTIHVTPDGIKTGCGAFIPEDAQLSRDTDVWYQHTNCYNCAYRQWPANTGYIRPHNGKDFPPRRECPHYPGREIDPTGCQTCIPSTVPRPSGDLAPRDVLSRTILVWEIRPALSIRHAGRYPGRLQSRLIMLGWGVGRLRVWAGSGSGRRRCVGVCG